MSVGATWRDEESGLLVRAGADSRTGGYRETNQDYVWLDPQLPLALVLDGMGGSPSGERAAQTGAEAIRDRAREGYANGEPPEALLEDAFRAGHDAVRHLNQAPAFRHSGATVVAAWVQEGRVSVTWLGDSGAYRLSGGRLERLTWEHNWANEVIRRGIMSKAEARDHRISRNLVNFLGQREPEPQFEFPTFVPRPGDRLILATDGVTGVLSNDTLLNTCRTIPDPTTCAEALVEHALATGSRDNCTCAVLAFEWVGAGPAPEPPAPQPPRKWWRFWNSPFRAPRFRLTV